MVADTTSPRLLLTSKGAIDGQLILRRAAKEHSCYVARHYARTGSERWEPADDCTPTIAKGDRYLEYMGEAGAYEAGTRYCAACAVKHWATFVEIQP